ncbi:putative NADH:ubiquinone oxidoreductase [Pseudonocardia sp. N23]|nr:putative NADH:ubiquinone oxidoreductase [Pseudonocardia sp. N23]
MVLVARPTPSGVDARSLAGLAAAVAASVADPVRVAHLDQAEPSIHDVLDEAVRDGAGTALLVPLAVPADAYLRTWIAKAVANWRETRAPLQLDVRLADDLTASAGAAAAVAALTDGEGEAVTASPGGFRAPSWSELPGHDRHLLLCRGPRCTAHGAGATHRALSAAARDEPGTLVTPIGCLGPCNLGPIVIETPGDDPEGTWHQRVDPSVARALAARRADVSSG